MTLLITLIIDVLYVQDFRLKPGSLPGAAAPGTIIRIIEHHQLQHSCAADVFFSSPNDS